MRSIFILDVKGHLGVISSLCLFSQLGIVEFFYLIGTMHFALVCV